MLCLSLFHNIVVAENGVRALFCAPKRLVCNRLTSCNKTSVDGYSVYKMEYKCLLIAQVFL